MRCAYNRSYAPNPERNRVNRRVSDTKSRCNRQRNHKVIVRYRLSVFDDDDDVSAVGRYRLLVRPAINTRVRLRRTPVGLHRTRRLFRRDSV